MGVRISDHWLKPGQFISIGNCPAVVELVTVAGRKAKLRITRDDGTVEEVEVEEDLTDSRESA